VPFVRTSCLPVRHRPDAFINCTEDGMSEMEKKDDIETEEFAAELSGEARDRAGEAHSLSSMGPFSQHCVR
jgi:hypothetical protein